MVMKLFTECSAMKKFLIIVIIIVFCLLLAACGERVTYH